MAAVMKEPPDRVILCVLLLLLLFCCCFSSGVHSILTSGEQTVLLNFNYIVKVYTTTLYHWK